MTIIEMLMWNWFDKIKLHEIFDMEYVCVVEKKTFIVYFEINNRFDHFPNCLHSLFTQLFKIHSVQRERVLIARCRSVTLCVEESDHRTQFF